MDIELHAGDVGEIWLNEGDVVCAIEASRFTLAGNEVETIDFLRRIADLFNCTVEYRDPGPSVEVICGVVVDHLTCSMPRGHEGRHFGNLLRRAEAYPGADHYLRMAGLIGADGQPGPVK